MEFADEGKSLQSDAEAQPTNPIAIYRLTAEATVTSWPRAYGCT